MSATTTPSEDELKSVLLAIKADNPTLGISKTHSLVLSTHPTWSVSEKRIRKILQTEGLIIGPTTAAENTSAKNPGKVYPTSRIIQDLDIGKWSKKVKVQYFNRMKGKGLVATEDINEGEIVWKEDPFIIAPEWDIYDLQKVSRACEYCTTPLGDSSLVVSCPASSSASHCVARFCNRLCLSRSNRTHPLLCPARNPASTPLLTFARKNQWMALHALAQCTARILLATQEDDTTLDADWKVVCGFAEMGMEERFKDVETAGAEPDRETWRKAYQLFVQAFQQPVGTSEKKRLERILKKVPRIDISRELFDYGAFLHGLGRMSLNMEAHGGLYTLHSHINHSCSPNISVRHLDTKTALSRITILAKSDIKVGEELLVSYVNPDSSLKERRHLLRPWGFGICECSRCIKEEQQIKESGGDVEMDDLEKELRAGLGVL